MRLELYNLKYFIVSVVNSIKHIPGYEGINADMLTESWKTAMKAGTGVAYGYSRNGNPTGILLGVYVDSPLSGEREASEYFWAVHPDERKNGIALNLLREFEDDARKAGCKSVVIGCSEYFKPDSLSRLYCRVGYSPVIRSFKKKL